MGADNLIVIYRVWRPDLAKYVYYVWHCINATYNEISPTEFRSKLRGCKFTTRFQTALSISRRAEQAFNTQHPTVMCDDYVRVFLDVHPVSADQDTQTVCSGADDPVYTESEVSLDDQEEDYPSDLDDGFDVGDTPRDEGQVDDQGDDQGAYSEDDDEDQHEPMISVQTVSPVTHVDNDSGANSEVAYGLDSDASELSVPDASDLAVPDAPELTVSDAPDLAVSDAPDLAVSDVPIMAVSDAPDVPDLAVSDVPDLTVSDVPDLAVRAERASVLLQSIGQQREQIADIKEQLRQTQSELAKAKFLATMFLIVQSCVFARRLFFY
jgi:hypothetical protein